MLHTTDDRAIDSITAFATSMDYLLDDDGNLAVEYNVPLGLVASFIEAEESRVEGRCV